MINLFKAKYILKNNNIYYLICYNQSNHQILIILIKHLLIYLFLF
jgi:hypothetical protein